MANHSKPYILGRFGTYGLLTLTGVFILLKLKGALTWSWWLILLPVWAPLSLLLILIELSFILYYLAIKKLL